MVLSPTFVQEYLAAQRSLIRLSRTLCDQIEGELRQLEEEVDSERASCLSAFENFDQKVNQLFGLIALVMKNEKEMSNSIVRILLS